MLAPADDRPVAGGEPQSGDWDRDRGEDQAEAKFHDFAERGRMPVAARERAVDLACGRAGAE
jgi:hypothetical protein